MPTLEVFEDRLARVRKRKQEVASHLSALCKREAYLITKVCRMRELHRVADSSNWEQEASSHGHDANSTDSELA